MKRYYWLKLKEDFFDDKRIKALRRLDGGDTMAVIYLRMQLSSLKSEGVIPFSGICETVADELALDMNEEPEIVRRTLEALQRFGLVEVMEGGTVFLPTVPECTGSMSDSAERMRRLRQKASQCDGDESQSAEKVTKRTNKVTGESAQPRTVPTAQSPEEPAPPKKPKKPKADPAKVKYAEFVTMTEDEYAKLVKEYGEAGAARLVELLDNYKGANGKRYNSDYRAILNWVVTRYKEEQERRGGKSAKTPKDYDGGESFV